MKIKSQIKNFYWSIIFISLFTLVKNISAAESNPVTIALTGSHTTYNVGIGQAYTELDTVPWGLLQAGDVVNIFYRETPYAWKIGLRGQGTEANPIVINGVTDENGNRPKFDFSGARTASGSNPGGNNNIFSSTPMYGETLGGIVIKRGSNDAYGSYSPKWIQIKNLELYGTANGNSYTTLAGGIEAYNASAGIYVLLGEDILIENNIVYDNGNGIFTMAKNDELSEAVQRVTLRNNRVYGNGVIGSDRQHNLYIQSTNPVIEGNYFGQIRTGSNGSTYKSRSSGEVFRYNYVQASARAIDFVYSEDQDNGIAAQPDYGTDYFYGNVIVSDFNLPNGGAAYSIHYGGDNLGEDGASGSLVNPATPYRSHLYFWNNTVIYRATQAQSWRMSVFDLSLVSTTADVWNNLIVLDGNSNFSLVEYAGNVNLRGNNLVYGTLGDARDTANADRYEIMRLGSLITGNPLLTNISSGDYTLVENSPAIDGPTNLPSDLPSSISTNYPIEFQPKIKTNGMDPRGVSGNSFDLGAYEFVEGGGDTTPPQSPHGLSVR